jgi:hypothetical protein
MREVVKKNATEATNSSGCTTKNGWATNLISDRANDIARSTGDVIVQTVTIEPATLS